jgi:hypothetical protein
MSYRVNGWLSGKKLHCASSYDDKSRHRAHSERQAIFQSVDIILKLSFLDPHFGLQFSFIDCNSALVRCALTDF